ncbi:MAG TPA: alkaline phosphatase family protein [bacterium]|nr:alkaline phosphatase family protein [bacterium]
MLRHFLTLFLLLAVSAGCAHAPRAARPGADRTLLIALDGVPYDMVREMRNEGRFAEFQPPSRVIAPFPSTTPCGFGGLFRPVGASPPMGYDREYYSYKDEKIIGFLSSVNPKNKRDFKNVFDYSRKTPLQKFWIYSAPGTSGRRDLEKIRRLVWKSTKTRLLTYIGGTDGTGHVLGPKRLKHWLQFMDSQLSKMRRDYRRDFGADLNIVLFSDHGFHYFRKPNAVSKSHITRELGKEGLKFAKNLKKPNGVVAIQWGNISGASFYARPENVPEVALVLAHTPGIDLVAYRKDGEIEVMSGERARLQTARVTCDSERRRCRYLPLDGDPLDYRTVMEDLKSKGRMDARGFASSDDWFAATQERFYPDALYRLHDGFFTLVENPAPILFSTEPEYEYGDVFTRVGAWFHGGLKGTHGGLFQSASAAFVMTTDPNLALPPVMRYDQVMPRVFKCREGATCTLPRFAHVDTPPPKP